MYIDKYIVHPYETLRTCVNRAGSPVTYTDQYTSDRIINLNS